MENSLILETVKKPAIINKQMLLAGFWWAYVAVCLTCVTAALGSAIYNQEWASVVISGSLLAACAYIFSSYLILSPIVFSSSRLIGQNKLAEAEQQLSRGLSIVRAFHLHKDWSYLTAVSNLAVVKLATGQFAEAELMYCELMDGIAKTKNKRIREHLMVAVYLNNLSYAHLRQDELEEAEENALKAKDIWAKSKGVEQSGLAFPLLNLAEIDYKRDNLPGAEKKLDQALALIHGPHRPALILERSYVALGVHARVLKSLICLKSDRKTEADKMIDEVIMAVRAGLRPPSGFNLSVIATICETYMALGDMARAEALMEQAYDTARAFPSHPHAPLLLTCYEDILRKTERGDEVEDMKSWVRPVMLDLDSVINLS